MIKLRRIIGILGAALLTVCCASCKSATTTTVFSSDNASLCVLNDLHNYSKTLEDKNLSAYIEFVINEAQDIISKTNKCDIKKAEKLLADGCSVYTTFDERVYSCICNHINDIDLKNTDVACAITDVSGNLLSVYSAGDKNCALSKTRPYSAFKPLSVYAPALEKNKICWSDTYFDSPYKTVTDSSGNDVDWPQNADNTYSKKEICIYEAIQKSLNTVAVKCLADYGVNNSISFLEKSFSLSLSTERKAASFYNEDEVIGNIAMGYIVEGCSPVDMAGYYQIFANGGVYTKPHAVSKITDKNGNILYEYKNTESKRVIKETTAYIMNKMLQGVVSEKGTGKAAAIKGVAVGGKTGTGVENDGNWFIGFTPQFVCSVWHGAGLYKNTSPEIFSNIMTEVVKNTKDAKRDYPNASGIKKELFCKDSGMLLTAKCKKMEMGYYVSGKIPDICNKH